MHPERGSSLSVAVVCWDLGHNALGRAHLLADMLAADHDVEVVGSHFPEFGRELWAPLRDMDIRVRRYPGEPFPGYFRTMQQMVRELTTDVVYVVKPRLPGLGVGLLAKVETGRPLMVDCDDLELSFVRADHGLSLAELSGLGDDPDFLRPQGRIWTSFSEWAVRFADSITVSNVPLAARYGGSVIPHARDERVFDPELYDRGEARARLGLTEEHRVVLFAGTPRRHKGIQQIAAALDRIGDPRNRLCVLATRELDELKAHVAGLEQWVHPVPPEPFSRLPQLLTAADVVCLLQDPASETARWQMPAKVSDALAMGVPCLTTRMPPLLPLIEEGGLLPVTGDDLDLHLESLLADSSVRAQQARRGRDIFLRRFSYAAVRPRLEEALGRAASLGEAPSSDLLDTVSFQRSAFGPAVNRSGVAPVPPPVPDHVARPAALLRSTLPPGAVVAVATKGEGRFLELEDLQVWHFPRTAEGEWAGYHPKDTAEIVGHLRDLRRGGARYFLIPSYVSWWLDHYVGLREHLLATGSLAAQSRVAGSLFELGPERRGDVVEPAVEPSVRPVPDRWPRRARSTAHGFDVVMFWKQHDTGLYGRRHDMLMKHLARSPNVGQVVQFDAPVDLASLRRRDPEVPTHNALLERLALARIGGVETVPGLHQHSFVYGGDRRGDRDLPTRDEYAVYVKDALACHGVGERPVVFWVYPKNLEFPNIARSFDPDLIVADVVDDHRTWLRPGGDDEERVLRNYEEIAASADVVLVNCEPMGELMAGMAANVHLVPNAADYPDPLASAPLEIPEELRSLHGPIVGYVGNLSSRIDVELLDRLVTRRPDWNLVLVGSAHAGRSIAPLARRPNVALLGPRPYEEAKRYIRAFDVALIPHLDDPMTRAMNPLKAFVYCALQVPVVSTDIANLGELRSLVSVASDHDDFIAKVDAAVRAGRAPIGSTADAVLRRNSWKSRTQVITDLLDEALRRKVGQ